VLAHLHIHNLAVVDEVELELKPGFNVLTGETGAGKSILVDALALALGERADSRAIRTGADRCEITARFDICGRPELRDWLRRNDLDNDDECILRRIVTSEGRSRGYVNGHAVPMQTLKNLGEQLVDICGQQTHQSLRHPRVQRDIIDHTGGHGILLATMREAYEQWQTTKAELDALTGNQQDRLARQDLLRYQVGELESLELQTGDFEKLEKEHLLVANSGRIAEGVSMALNQLYEADAGTAHAAINSAKQQLAELAEFDAHLETAVQMLSEAEILVSETVAALREQTQRLEHDPQRLQELEQRIASIHELARKHRIDAAALPELAVRLATELEQLNGSDERLAELTEKTGQAEERVQATARKLTRARHKSAVALDARVTENMQGLGMPGGEFKVDLQTAGIPGAVGADRIEFVVSANPGHTPGPLGRVASGGELSRVSLAVQVAAMTTEAIPTLIFDEIDAGVGGGVAEIVGNRLQELSSQRQVLCVTHLPQVASQADHHLRVTKMSDGVTTRTSVNALTGTGRVEEIARMLGGVEITSRTRAHAKEMLNASHARRSVSKAG
jgi:DNA repair protein RecN (Recombination protein N)